MRNESVVARIPVQLPRDLEPDFLEFRDRIGPYVDSGKLSLEAFQLLIRFGQLVYTQIAQLSIVAREDRSVIFTRHILDSLNPVDAMSRSMRSALDIGSGGGFPGVPLAIAWPHCRVTVLESREKKAGFLERAVRELELKNVTVVCARLEEYGRSWTAEPQESIFVRALLPDVLLQAGRVAAPGAQWVYYLGSGTPTQRVAGQLGDLGRDAETIEGSFGGRLLTGHFPPGRIRRAE